MRRVAAVPLIVNCPRGHAPQVDSRLPDGAMDGVGGHGRLDYNPEETTLLKKASSLGARTLNGVSMLQLQADAAWEIWTGAAD